MKRTAIALVAFLLITGGCGLLDNPSPNRARLVIEGEAGKALRVIISTQFVAQINELDQTTIVLFAADTVFTELPYEQVYVIEEDQRFFVEAARMDTDLTNLQMQVFIDQDKEFDEGGALLQDQPYRFVYTFNQRTTREIVVL